MNRLESTSDTVSPSSRDNAPDRSRVGLIAQWTLWLFAALIAATAIYAQRPPTALGHAAPPDRFSAARAMDSLRQIAQRPHPLGSTDNQRVRQYLVQALRSLGADVHVETSTGITQRRGRFIAAGLAHGIVAKFPGSANNRAVMLTAHYDSVNTGPGAADDGAGVVTILETLRALKAGPPLKNDVWVVFTDGEEEGLLGAAAFVADHPDVKQHVGAVMNFEARGSSGPASMFETSDGNGWLVQQFAEAAPYPIASSLGYTLYKQLPNDNDLTVFKRAGLAGLNFAPAQTFQSYHTRYDNIEDVSPDTLQHMGSSALALTRHFGNLSLHDIHQPDRVYFDWLGSHLIQYPTFVSWVLLAIAALLFVAVLTVAIRQRRLSFWRFVGGVAGFVLLMLAVSAAVLAAWWLIESSIGGRLLIADALSNELMVVGMVLVGIAAGVLMLRVLIRWWGSVAIAAGMLFVAGILTALVSVSLPGVSYLLEWPLIAGLLGLLLVLLTRRSGVAAALGMACAIPGILLFAPLMFLLLVLLDLNIVSVVAIAVLLGLLLALSTPLLAHLDRGWRITVPVQIIAAIVLLVWGGVLSHYSVLHPRRDTLYYSIAADQDKAAWVSYDAAPDAWTAQFLGTRPQRGTAPDFTLGSNIPVLTRQAPLLPLQAPAVTKTGDVFADGVRTLTLHIDSVRHANALLMRLPGDADLISIAWNGRKLPILRNAKAAGPWMLSYYGLPTGGIDLQLRLAGDGPLKCRIGDLSFGLPRIPGFTYRPQRAEALIYGENVTVSRSFTF